MSDEFAIVTTKGQLVIPAKLRRKYSIRKGTRVAFIEDNGRLILQPITPDFIRSLQGSLGKDSRVLEFLYAERRRERKL
jgi:AbrB family looped-hinge helix DNA binding protein